MRLAIKTFTVFMCLMWLFLALATDDLRKSELARFQEVREAIRKDGVTLTGFYHISAWRPKWKDVVKDQLYIMAGKRSALGDFHSASASLNAPPDSDRGFTPSHWASILDVLDHLQINIASPDPSTYTRVKSFIFQEMSGSFTEEQLKKLRFSRNETLLRGTFANSGPEKRAAYMARGNLSEGESSTLSRLKDYCEAQRARHKKTLVFYIHDKGACCYPNLQRTKPDSVSAAVASWRDAMHASILEFPSVCLRALLGGYTTCGYGSQGGKAHFSGNFWWADCGHMAALPAISTYFDAWRAEFFILRTSRNLQNRLDIMHRCAYEVHHCGGNHYAEPCKRATYYHRLLSLVNQSDLPPLTSSLSDTEYAGRRKDKRVDILKGVDLSGKSSSWSPSSPVLTRECRQLYEATQSYMSSAVWSSPLV